MVKALSGLLSGVSGASKKIMRKAELTALVQTVEASRSIKKHRLDFAEKWQCRKNCRVYRKAHHSSYSKKQCFVGTKKKKKKKFRGPFKFYSKNISMFQFEKFSGVTPNSNLFLAISMRQYVVHSNGTAKSEIQTELQISYLSRDQ